MTTTVLAYFPSPGQGVWYLGPFPIRAYALCIIAGIIAALVVGDRRWAARGGERGVIYDIALWAVPFGLIGGRLYHLMTDWKTYFGPGGAGIGAAARIWEGGLGIWGAVALGAVGAWIGCRRKGIPLPAFGDAVAPGIVLAQAIGRLGNYFNQELYGRETAVPWGMEIFYRRDNAGVVDVHSLDGVSTGQVAAVVHPTFLYELLWNLLVFVFLIWADRKFRLGHGRLFALYVAAYCVGRFGVELMRDDTATHIAGIRINVFTAVFVFIGAVVYFLLAPKGRENPASLRGRQALQAPHEESRVEEWAGDLVAAAAGSGIVAAATVAGEHEDEDSEAVGDIESDGEPTEFIEPVAADESVEDEGEQEADDEDEAADLDELVEDAVEIDSDAEVDEVLEDEDAAEIETSEEEVEAVDEAEAEDETVAEVVDSELEVEPEAAAVDVVEAELESEEPESEDVAHEDGVNEDGVTDDDDVDVDVDGTGDDEAVIVYEGDDEPEAETVVVYESGSDVAEDGADGEAEAEAPDHGEGEPDDTTEGDVAEDIEAEPVAEEAEAEADEAEADEADEAEADEAVADEAEADEAVAELESDVAAAPEAEVIVVEELAPEPEPAAEPDPAATANAVAVSHDGEEPQPKIGKTLKRLLWGSRNKG